MITSRGPTVLPTSWLPKATALGSETTGNTPVPSSLNVRGTVPAAALVCVATSCAERGPVPAGVNVTPKVQDSPGFRLVVPLPQPAVSTANCDASAPPIARPCRSILPEPALRSVTVLPVED